MTSHSCLWKIWIFLGMVCFLPRTTVGQESRPASVPDRGVKVLSLRLDIHQIISSNFLGFGVELDPMVLNANNRKRGVTEEDWKLLTDRLAAMKMPIVRMMCQLSWVARSGPAQFDYETPQAKSLRAYLDFCQQHDVDVILTDWAWVGECRWLQGVDDPAYAKGIATYLKYLLEEKKYSCIKYLVVSNEPDNEIKDLDKYGRMYHHVDVALKTAGLRQRIKLMGPDIGGQWDWFDQAAARIADVVDAYDFHRYAEMDEVRDDGQKMLLRNLGRFRPVVNRVDPQGRDKPILMTEMGMAGGGTNAHAQIDTFDYALHMGDYAIGVLNSGAKAGLAWCAFDVYYFDGDQFMSWGMWKYKDRNWQPKPWHSVWQQVTRAVPRGWDVLAVEGGTAEVHAAALGGERGNQTQGPSDYRKFVLLLANRGSKEVQVELTRPRAMGGTWWRVCCQQSGIKQTDPVPWSMVDGPIRVQLPGESFTVVRLDFTPAK